MEVRPKPGARSPMNGAILGGAAYFLVMFALGFVLGTVRVLLLAPRLGEWSATFVELPVMLAISWVVCRWLVGRLGVPERATPRLVMGAVAFVLLMIAEVVLGTSLFDRSLSQQVQAMTGGPGLAGLLGQMVFAAFPLAQMRSSGRA
jgi:ABC-type uncharacterized transport system permease subunit